MNLNLKITQLGYKHTMNYYTTEKVRNHIAHRKCWHRSAQLGALIYALKYTLFLKKYNHEQSEEKKEWILEKKTLKCG